MSLLVFWPRTCSLAMAALNSDIMNSWLSIMACQKQAVLGSWETTKSLCRRISPASGERTSPGWDPFPGKSLPLRRTSRKTWESKVKGVESKGVPGIVVSTTSAAAMVCEARRATASLGLKPASAKRAKIAVTESVGSGMVRSGAAALGAGRPNLNSRRGAPGQLAVPTAAARWTLRKLIDR